MGNKMTPYHSVYPTSVQFSWGNGVGHVILQGVDGRDIESINFPLIAKKTTITYTNEGGALKVCARYKRSMDGIFRMVDVNATTMDINTASAPSIMEYKKYCDTRREINYEVYLVAVEDDLDKLANIDIDEIVEMIQVYDEDFYTKVRNFNIERDGDQCVIRFDPTSHVECNKAIENVCFAVASCTTLYTLRIGTPVFLDLDREKVSMKGIDGRLLESVQVPPIANEAKIICGDGALRVTCVYRLNEENVYTFDHIDLKENSVFEFSKMDPTILKDYEDYCTQRHDSDIEHIDNFCEKVRQCVGGFHSRRDDAYVFSKLDALYDNIHDVIRGSFDDTHEIPIERDDDMNVVVRFDASSVESCVSAVHNVMYAYLTR